MNKGVQFFSRMVASLMTSGLMVGVGVLTDFALPKPAAAAEEIRLLIGGPLVFSVSVDSLETYTQTGEIAEDLRLFTRFANDQALAGLQQALQSEIPLSVQQVSNLGYSDLGEDVLLNLGKVVRPHIGLNGDRALRGAMLGAASEARETGTAWTPIDVLKHYPGKTIEIQAKDLLALRRLLATYLGYNQAAIAAIQTQATQEAANQVALPKDLTQPGPYAVETITQTFTRSAPRQTRAGMQENYTFDVDTFLPQLPEQSSQPAPVVIVSHGYSDTKENFSFLGQHLATHGFVVLIPEHVGSDLAFRLNYTDGLLNTAMNPSEFISRPEEISYLIDQLEAQVAASPDWAARLDLSRIGMVGHSLGASTAQSLAGATINRDRLAIACGQEQITLNLSLYLQCQARFLPPETSNLQDARIKAVISANGLSSQLYGPEGLENIELPFMMVSASKDVVAPSIAEQIHPFFWVGSSEKYLAVMPEGSHFSFTAGEATGAVSPLTQPGAEELAALVIGEHRDVGARYLSALNLAFWSVYLKEDRSYEPYLSAQYGTQLSVNEPVALNLVQQLTPEAIVTAYGQQPPTPIFPEPVGADRVQPQP
ncbi:MAG: alpha/beta hydrolase [Cyanobacteria bacterium J06597_16]